MQVVKIHDYLWEIPPSEKPGMLVPARIYANPPLLGEADGVVLQAVTGESGDDYHGNLIRGFLLETGELPLEVPSLINSECAGVVGNPTLRSGGHLESKGRRSHDKQDHKGDGDEAGRDRKNRATSRPTERI